MKKRYWAAALALCLLLTGCGGNTAGKETLGQTQDLVPEETEATVPPDGNAQDVTCKGSYTVAPAPEAVVATAGQATLTNEQLQVWYWAEVAQYRQSGQAPAPDFDRPLDRQSCQIDPEVASWQQYFLKRALHTWHSAQALDQQSREVPLETEEAYQPNLDNHATYLTGKPATKYLYGYQEFYSPNTLHQAYLDSLEQTLETLAGEKGYDSVKAMAQEGFGSTQTALMEYAQVYNRSYMYLTHLGYDLKPEAEEVERFRQENQGKQESGHCVDIRHILLVPEDAQTGADGKITASEESWAACEAAADTLLKQWGKNNLGTEATFAELANKQSQDTGTALDGGAYHHIRQGQLIEELDSWCFDGSRQSGDTTVIRTDLGCHILYFSGSTELGYVQAEEELTAQMQSQVIQDARKAYPMEVNYSAIALVDGAGTVSAGEVLYPDVAHERFPEVPLYLQQDYPKTMFGGFKITTNGCGITSMAMLASYLADEEWTPPEMCALYGRYSHSNGTDGMIFNKEPAVLGFYLKEKVYDPRAAKQALEEGYIVVSIQHKGYWTRGGHYIVLESIDEDGLVQVRDSNIYNYGKLEAHKVDKHTWGSITGAGSGYWIFEYKITTIPACSRCGTPEETTGSILKETYTCHKCQKALLRREVYLSGGGESDF